MIHRFTDFLVYEVDLDHNVIHIKSLDMPESSKKEKVVHAPASTTEPLEILSAPPIENTPMEVEEPSSETPNIGSEAIFPSEVPSETETSTRKKGKDKDKKAGPVEPWPGHFNTALKPFFSEEGITEVKKMFLEGPEPPRISDSGWGGRRAGNSEGESTSALETAPEPEKEERERRGGRGGRGGRAGRGDRGGRSGGMKEDHRKVLSNVRGDSVSRKNTY